MRECRGSLGVRGYGRAANYCRKSAYRGDSIRYIAKGCIRRGRPQVPVYALSHAALASSRVPALPLERRVNRRLFSTPVAPLGGDRGPSALSGAPCEFGTFTGV